MDCKSLNKYLTLTHLNVYAIDPENCTDADDAFSVIKNEKDTILWIFIADPTLEYTLEEFLNSEMLKNGTTKYYIDKTPEHLFPEDIVEKYSLNKGIKPALGVKVVFDKNYNILESSVMNVKIKIKEHKCYTTTEIDPVLEEALRISDSLFEKRTGKGKILHNYFLAEVKKSETGWKLYNTDVKTRNLKNLIAEYAILANCVIAEITQHTFTRQCNTVNEDYKDPVLFLENIVKNGIKATYTTNQNEKHLMIDDKFYTHFTSPLRRASDCLVHYILRGEIIEKTTLQKHAERINMISKQNKKRSWEETKKAILNAMNKMPKPINVKIRITGQYNQFLNMSIVQINEFPVLVSLSMKMKEQKKYTNINIKINTINIEKKFDSEILPEIFNLLKN